MAQSYWVLLIVVSLLQIGLAVSQERHREELLFRFALLVGAIAVGLGTTAKRIRRRAVKKQFPNILSIFVVTSYGGFLILFGLFLCFSPLVLYGMFLFGNLCLLLGWDCAVCINGRSILA